MNLILTELKAYLQDELKASGPLSIGKPVRVVSTRPPKWILENYNARYFPAVFIWGADDNYDGGEATDTLDGNYDVTIQVVMQSTKKAFSALSPHFGIFGLTKRIINLLLDNKRLNKPNGIEVVSGLMPQIRVRSAQLEIEDKLSALGRIIAVRYVRERLPYHWRRQDETKIGNASIFAKFE